MYSATDWKEIKYQEVLEEELRGLQRRKYRDDSFCPDDIRALLRDLYHMEGADWGGRGEVQDLMLQATIAAHERFLAEWESEEGGATKE